VTQALHRFKAEFFKALAHPARIRLLELLRGGERTVSELQVQLDMDPSSVSQQLAVLRAKNIVQTRKMGTSVYYSVRDPQVYILLDAARAMFDTHLSDLQAMLEQQRMEDETTAIEDGLRLAPAPR
jgi:ArsR family transcriptional regulator